MKVINLTPHDVDICDEYGNVIKTYKASGMVARVRHYWSEIDNVDGVPIVTRENEHLVDLPEAQEGVFYIVSNIVLEYCNDRFDLLAPVKQVKINGRVVGCQAFVGNR